MAKVSCAFSFSAWNDNNLYISFHRLVPCWISFYQRTCSKYHTSTFNNIWHLPSCTLCNWAPQKLTLKNNLFQKCTVIIYSFRFCMISFCCVQWNHPTERKKKNKSRWFFCNFFFELWKLVTHHWVFTIALGVRLHGADPVWRYSRQVYSCCRTVSL